MGCGGSKQSDTALEVDTVKQPKEVPVRTDDITPTVKSAPAAAKTNAPRRAGVSAETGGADDAPARKSMAGAATVKTPEQRAMIATATGSSPLFESLTRTQMEEVIEAMVEEKREQGEVVIQQGDKGDFFYVVATGEYSVYLSKVENGTKCVKVYKSGETFGELALMYNTPRAATVKCSSSGSVFCLDRATFRAILMAANKEAMDSTAAFLKSVAVFSPLTDGQRDALSNVLEECRFGPKETICREGDMADALYLVREGELIAYKKEDGKEQVSALDQIAARTRARECHARAR